MSDIAEQLTHARAAEGSAALQRYARLLGRFPTCLPAYLEMAALLTASGNSGEALRVLSRSLDVAQGEGDRAAVTSALAPLLATLRPTRYHPRLDSDLRACFDNPQLDPQPLAQVTARLLLARYRDPGNDLAEIARDPLWIAFLSRCINTLPEMEPRIAAMRRTLIAESADGDADLLCAMALQCFANEYALTETPDERERIAHLLDAIASPSDVLRCALYDPLDAIVAPAHVEALRELPIGSDLVKRSRDDLCEERRLAEAMPALKAILPSDDPVSARVREQYEANPYPRWQAPPTVQMHDMGTSIAGVSGIDATRLKGPPLTVLIAGCGTGYEAIDIARSDPSLAVTAIDLSRASLAYGQRVANELGLNRIAFLHGDILDIVAPPGGFDLVICTGVLHHMAQPEKGLDALARAAAQGAVFRLGLYSARARAPVAIARDYIRDHEIAATGAGIRAFREHVLALPAGHPMAQLRDSADFYSLSGCRDLVFHVQEHVYSMPDAVALIEGAGLRFAGVDAPGWVVDAFHEAHGPSADPLDPMLWDALEERHPTMFAGMYHLWCQK